MEVIVLGSGGSTGTPSVEFGWGQCNPDIIENRRLRAGVYIKNKKSSILIDTGPDLRQQLLDNKIDTVDAIIYTHAHADHTHGINDVRSLNRLMKRALPAYMSHETFLALSESFPWIFKKAKKENEFYKTSLDAKIIQSGQEINITGTSCLLFEQSHGHTQSYGIQFGKEFVLTTDVVKLTKEAIESYKYVKHWMVGMIGYKAHPTHAHYDLIRHWADLIQPENIWITHIGLGLDHKEMIQKFPDNMRPVYDTQIIKI